MTPNWLFDEPKVADSAVLADAELMMAAHVYDALAERYTGQRTHFIPPTLKDKKKLAEKQAQLRRLLARCQELGVGVEIYLAAQFEELGYVLKKMGLARPPMSQILSESAIERFNKYLDRIEKSYVTKRDRLRQHLRGSAVDRLALSRGSAKRFITRLERVRTHERLTKDVAIHELEMAARVGFVSGFYVAISPIVDSGDSSYLKALKASILRTLNKDQQSELMKARVALGSEHAEIREYV